jgi:hypothetical protein
MCLSRCLRGHRRSARRRRPRFADGSIVSRARTAFVRHEGDLAALSRQLREDRTQIRRWREPFGVGHDDADAVVAICTECIDLDKPHGSESLHAVGVATCEVWKK